MRGMGNLGRERWNRGKGCGGLWENLLTPHSSPIDGKRYKKACLSIARTRVWEVHYVSLCYSLQAKTFPPIFFCELLKHKFLAVNCCSASRLIEGMQKKGQCPKMCPRKMKVHQPDSPNVAREMCPQMPPEMRPANAAQNARHNAHADGLVRGVGSLALH